MFQLPVSPLAIVLADGCTENRDANGPIGGISAGVQDRLHVDDSKNNLGVVGWLGFFLCSWCLRFLIPNSIRHDTIGAAGRRRGAKSICLEMSSW